MTIRRKPTHHAKVVSSHHGSHVKASHQAGKHHKAGAHHPHLPKHHKAAHHRRHH